LNSSINSIFQLSWSDDSEKDWLLKKLLAMKRQTMNIRLMKQSKFVLLKDDHGEPIGWGGLDLSLKKDYPEMFSLYLDPQYRKFNLGILLELARASFLTNHGIKLAYVRMTDDDTSADLLTKRLRSKFYSRVNPLELDQDYVEMCNSCELYNQKCQKQVFLKFNVEAFVEQTVAEIGSIDGNLPKHFRLIRTSEVVSIASGDQNAQTHMWRSYRPLWIQS